MSYYGGIQHIIQCDQMGNKNEEPTIEDAKTSNNEIFLNGLA